MATTVQPDRAAAARLFHALSDETRLAVLEFLAGESCCVCDIGDALGLAQPRLSFHLKVLREAGLVTDCRQGRWIYYGLNPAGLEEAGALIEALREGSSGRCGTEEVCCS